VAPIEAPAVRASLIAFVFVYFAVFGAGTFYLLRMMSKIPRSDQDWDIEGPTRAAGITPVTDPSGPQTHSQAGD
jgi:cytochrome bd ubiquinol oxidase subunit I